MHRGPAGTIELNKALKAELNPGDGTVWGFDVGDRVVATANHLDLEPVGFANGEVGVVTGTGDGSLDVDFASGPVHRHRARRCRPQARLGDHRAPRAGLGVARRRRRAAAGGRRDAVPAAGLHRADPRAAAPVDRARQRVRRWPGRCARSTSGRGAPGWPRLLARARSADAAARPSGRRGRAPAGAVGALPQATRSSACADPVPPALLLAACLLAASAGCAGTDEPPPPSRRGAAEPGRLPRAGRRPGRHGRRPGPRRRGHGVRPGHRPARRRRPGPEPAGAHRRRGRDRSGRSRCPGTPGTCSSPRPAGRCWCRPRTPTPSSQVALPGGEVTETMVGDYPHDAAQVASGQILVGDEMGGTLSVVDRRRGHPDLRQPDPARRGGHRRRPRRGRGRRRVQLTTYDVAAGELQTVLDAGDGPTHVVADGRGRFLVADTRGDAMLVFGSDPLELESTYAARRHAVRPGPRRHRPGRCG